jgi:hypothetical protein
MELTVDNILILPKFLDECPIYWQNFFRSTTPGSIHSTLKEVYNAIAYTHENKVQFATANDLTLFVLAWS